MNNIAQSDIFFFISSAFFILLIIFLLIIMYYIIPIVRDFRAIIKSAKNTSENTFKNIDRVQDDMSAEARAVVKGVGKVLNSLFFRNK